MRKYLIDSNSFMESAEKFYNYEIAPTYWIKLIDAASKKGCLYVLDVVADEISRGKDDDPLRVWFSENESSFNRISQSSDNMIVGIYAQVLQYVQECGYYNEKALRNWSNDGIADPWLIAAAKVHDLVIVTFERRQGGLSTTSKTGCVKIPDVADYFDVETISLYTMMRELGIRL